MYAEAVAESRQQPTPSPEDWVADYGGMLEAWRGYLGDMARGISPSDAYVRKLIKASAFYKYMTYMADNYFSV